MPDERDDELARERMAGWHDNVSYDDGPDWHLAQFYVAAGFPYEGMYLGMLEVFDISAPGGAKRTYVGGEDGVGYIELVSSRDLKTWSRAGDRGMLIPLGEAKTWEAGWIGTTDRPVIVGDRAFIYYGGLQPSHGGALFQGSPKQHDEMLAEIQARVREKGRKYSPGGIGLATLRLDGWVSVDAGPEGGVLTTKPVVFEAGGKLVINAEAPKGSVVVEILDAADKTVPGFGVGDCDAFTGDAIRHTVTWRGESDVSTLAGKAVRLRFHLKNAKFYSFVFQG